MKGRDFILNIEKKLLERQIKSLQNTIKQKDEEIDLYKEMLEKVSYGDTEQIFTIVNDAIEKYNALCGLLEQSRINYDELIKEQKLLNAKYRKEMDGILKKMR